MTELAGLFGRAGTRTLVRALFALTLAVVTVLAFIPLDHPPVSGNDKLNHVAAFAVLATLAIGAFPNAPPWRWILPGLLGYGLFIEVTQHFLPWRTFSIADLAADLVGILGALGLWSILGRVQDRRASAGATRSASSRDKASSSS